MKVTKEQVQRGEQCPHCGRYYDRHLVVDGIVLHEGNILLIKRGIEPEKGWWALPGGYVDWNETIEQAALREVKEETGVVAAVDKLVGVYSSPVRSPHDMQTIAAVFLMNLIDQSSLQRQQEEIEDVRWYPVAKLPPLAFDHEQMIRDALSK